jgi:hypothetical protein
MPQWDNLVLRKTGKLKLCFNSLENAVFQDILFPQGYNEKTDTHATMGQSGTPQDWKIKTVF